MSIPSSINILSIDCQFLLCYPLQDLRMNRKFKHMGDRMKKYSTKQREVLMEFFELHPHKQFTAHEIASELSEEISQSAVYRNLSEMEKDGIISRSIKEGCRESMYQYTMAEECKNAIHLTCVKCGNIKHMDASIAESMRKAALEKNEFFIGNAMLYGVCGNCEKVKVDSK